MSRLAIPGFKDEAKKPTAYMKQVCIYAFTFSQLKAFSEFGRKGASESCEDIEILRFMELNIPVHMVECGGSPLAVDIPEDIEKVEIYMKENGIE